jgi:hypothetical protein
VPWHAWWLVLLLAGVLVTALTFPTVPDVGRSGRLNTGDGRFSIWNVAWVDHALLHDPAHLFDANIFYPHTGTLAYSELNLVAGVLGLPAYAVTGNALAALNSALVAGLVIAFLSMFALVRRLTGSGAGAVVGATAFTFCPFVQVHTAHIQLLMVFGFPLVCLAFHRLADSPGLWRAVQLGAALAVAALACAYYGLFLGCALGVMAVAFATRQRIYWIALGSAAVTAALLVLPVLAPYLRARALSGATRTLDLDELRSYSATLSTYVSSPAHLHAWWLPGVPGSLLSSIRPGPESLFPGVLVLLLAGLGVATTLRQPGSTERRLVWGYLALAAFAFWMSFGPDSGLYLLFVKIVPWMSMLRAPVRFGVVVTFALAVLAGLGVKRLVGSGRMWLTPVLLIGMVGELAAVPWPLAEVPPLARAYRVLAGSPRGPVVEFPFPYVSSDYHHNSWPMFWSTYHWQPLVNGYSDFIPPDFDAIALPITGFPDAASFEIMRARQVRYIVWHMETYDEPSRARLLARFPPYERYLKPLVKDGDVWLYEIVGWPTAPGGGP